MEHISDKSATIICGGSLMCVTSDKGKLAPEVYKILMERLSYEHRYSLHGLDAYDSITGEYRPVRVETRHLYTLDDYGRLCCGIGFRYYVESVLSEYNYKVKVLFTRDWATHPRKNRFKAVWENIDINKLRRGQIDCLALANEFLNATFSAPPGFGKTFLFGQLALLFPNARIHIVVDSLDIQARIMRDLVKQFPRVGIVNGQKKQFERVTVVSADSLKHVDGSDRKSNKGADIVIAEEVHRLMAHTYIEGLVQYKFAKMLAFSATVTGRFDQGDRKLESLFGPVVFNKTYQEAVDDESVVPIQVEWIHVNGSNVCAGKRGIAKERHGIWRNNYRNDAIANHLSKFDADTQVLVLVSKIEHAIELKQCMPEYTLCYGSLEKQRYDSYVKKGYLDPSDEPMMNSERRVYLRSAFESGELKKVIATDVWSTGVDFDKLQVICRADGRCSSILDYQIPGRVTRRSDGKNYGLVIDCLDLFDSTFKKRSQQRHREYNKHGWISTNWNKRL